MDPRALAHHPPLAPFIFLRAPCQNPGKVSPAKTSLSNPLTWLIWYLTQLAPTNPRKLLVASNPVLEAFSLLSKRPMKLLSANGPKAASGLEI